MEECDLLALGADSGLLVDETDAGLAAAVESAIEIVDYEADVMNPRTPFGDEFADGRIGLFGLEELDQGIAGGQPGNPGAI